MYRYILRRLLLLVPVLLLVSVVIFGILRVLPGDVAIVMLMSGDTGAPSEEQIASLQRSLGLDRPLYEQYLSWMWGLVQLDAGASFYTQRSVVMDLQLRIPRTLELALLTVMVSALIAIPTGVIAAMRQDTWLDYVVRIVTVGGIAMPTFWFATLILLFLVVGFNWMPPLGYKGFFADPWSNLQQMVWPALAMGYYHSSMLARMVRSSVLEVLRQDYIRTAWSKGLRERVVMARHTLRNAFLPVVTLLGTEFAVLMGGTVIVETIFVIPGMGSYLIESIHRRDYFVTQAIIVAVALMLAVINLVVDITYGWIDPRIRYR